MLPLLGWVAALYACSGFFAACMMTLEEVAVWRERGGLSPASVCGVYVFSVTWVYASMLISLACIPGLLLGCDLSEPSKVMFTPFILAWNALVTPVDIIGKLPRGPVVFVANHRSMADCAIPLKLDGRIRIVAKRPLLFTPGIGAFMWMLGSIFVDTKASVLEKCARAIRSKESVFMFPQGTRGRGSSRLPFRNGAFEVALANRCPVVCLSIYVPRSTWSISGTDRIRVTVHEPIEPGSHTVESLRYLCFETVYSAPTDSQTVQVSRTRGLEGEPEVAVKRKVVRTPHRGAKDAEGAKGAEIADGANDAEIAGDANDAECAEITRHPIPVDVQGLGARTP